VAATAGNRTISAQWAHPDDTGNSPIIGFELELTSGDDSWAFKTPNTSWTAADLMNGRSYSLRVAAYNAVGTGTWTTAISNLVPHTTPGAPSGLLATSGDLSARFTWTPPEDDGGMRISGYVLEVTSDDTVAIHRADDDTRASLAGLVNGTLYSVRVAAVNAAGDGPWSEAALVRPMPPPVSVPRDVTAVRKGTTITVRWLAPAQGVVRRYIIGAAIGTNAFKVVGSTRKTTFAFKAKGAASIQVAAGDGYTRSAWSTPVTAPRAR